MQKVFFLQVASILSGTIGEGSSRLGVLLGLPPLSLVDMLHAIGGGFCLLSGCLNFVWQAYFWLLTCLDFGPCCLFLLLSLYLVFSFYEVCRVSTLSLLLKCIIIVEIFS
jgi:hypothetical protein